jgi:hypothetical protein
MTLCHSNESHRNFIALPIGIAGQASTCSTSSSAQHQECTLLEPGRSRANCCSGQLSLVESRSIQPLPWLRVAIDHLPFTRNFVAETANRTGDPFNLDVGSWRLGIPTLRPLTWPFSGGEGTRTLGLYIANVALYQLSYTPEVPKETSRADP